MNNKESSILVRKNSRLSHFSRNHLTPTHGDQSTILQTGPANTETCH